MTDKTTAERFEHLQIRAVEIGKLPMLSQAAEARSVMADAFGVLADMARDVEALKPYADEDADNA